MSPDLNEEPKLNSYDFQDAIEIVIVHLYATGAIEQKDVEVLPDIDTLEIHTPDNQKWVFQLYEHIYPDQTEMTSKINETRTQTTIELRLHKQQTQTTWPQLCSYLSNPKTPQQNDQNIDMIDLQIDYSHPYELSLKKLRADFTETNTNKAISKIYIKDVYNCQVQFTETNFTATFYTNDTDILERCFIAPSKPIRLFVRVKERIKPDQCSHIVTPAFIEITLIKDNENHSRWNQLEPNEYSESRPLMQSSLSPLALTYTNSSINNLNRAIPLPSPLSIDRQSDKYSYGSLANQKDIIHASSATTSVGYTGIYNPANSCFMNAAIQCLSNTRELRDYFLKAYYRIELNRTNPLGMKGEMAEEFAKIIQELWSGEYKYIDANNLRKYAAKRHQEFVGNGQHDAQELLTILLDAIHEDLNRVINKPLVPSIESADQPDYVVADESWRGYLSRNDSIIVQLFTGQFKSKTKCPQCQKESVTFDPFTSLSVPLPKRIAIDTIVTFRNDEKPPTKYRIVMSSEGSIGELKRLLSNKCGLSITKMLAYKLQGSRSIEYLKDEERVSSSSYSWSSFDTTYITEILTSAECNNEPIIQLTFSQRIFKIPEYLSACAYCQASPNPHSSQKYCTKCYRASYCDEQCQKFHAKDHSFNCEFRSSDNYENVGYPFIISLPESKLTCENVFEQISIHAKRSVDINIERSKQTRSSFEMNGDYGGMNDDEEEDSFSDIENVDWTTIKKKLSSCDAWSICRIGDYFVKTSKNKRRHNQQNDRKEKILKSLPTNINEDEESMIITGDSGSNSGTEDFDMLDDIDIYGSQPLFRIMPQTTDNSNHNIQPIVEPGDDSDSILRCHTTFSIDWFTDNKMEAPLSVTPSKHHSGINGLIDDDSVSNSSSGDQEVTLQQCLQLFIEPEVLGPDDKWFCPHCKEHIQAEKKMSVWRLPPILIIQLKRFKYNQSSSFGYTSSSREKIDTTVKFPVHDLNMTPYCSSVSEEDQSQTRYDLYGIINHCGTAWFGHYTSYGRLLGNNDSAKTEIGWRHFDDDRVSTLANVKDLVRADAYVLFYRHRNLPVNFVLQEQLQRLLSEQQTCENNN